jgi:hypothetical protein
MVQKWKTILHAALIGNYPNGMPDASVIYLKGFPALEEEAKIKAKQIAAVPIMIDALTRIAEWDSFKDHPIVRYAQTALDATK